MSDFKGTPGPWAATNKEHGTWRTDIRAGVEGEGRRVATTFVLNSPRRKRGESLVDYRDRYDRQARQNEANARLIAAAPELLEALVAAMPAVETLWTRAHMDEDAEFRAKLTALIAKMDAAIAKALGEQS